MSYYHELYHELLAHCSKSQRICTLAHLPMTSTLGVSIIIWESIMAILVRS